MRFLSVDLNAVFDYDALCLRQHLMVRELLGQLAVDPINGLADVFCRVPFDADYNCNWYVQIWYDVVPYRSSLEIVHYINYIAEFLRLKEGMGSNENAADA